MTVTLSWHVHDVFCAILNLEIVFACELRGVDRQSKYLA